MSYPKPFRFGVFAESCLTRRQLLETARAAEELGYSTFLLRDHFIEAPFGHQFEPMTALMMVALATTKLRVGTLVCANDYRHPVMLAKAAATLDVLSEGRFELGLGAGFSQAEYAAAGLPFDPPGVRVDRLAESLHVIKLLFGASPTTFTGRHYTITDLDSYPKPIQQSGPPIHIGAANRRMLELAARQADIIGLQTVTTTGGALGRGGASRAEAAVLRQLDWVRQAAGDRFPALEISSTATIVIADHPREAAADLIRRRGWPDVTIDDVLAMPSVFIGPESLIIETMQRRRERFGYSYFVINDSDLRNMAPIVARLANT